MRYFKDCSGEIYAFDDSQLHLVSEDMVEMSQDEVDERLLVKETFAQAIAKLNFTYVKDRDELCAAWLRAAVADGVEESSRKEDVEMELAELDAKHSVDVETLKSKYGVS